MNYKDRLQVAKDTFVNIENLLMGKGKEYGSDTDANANFFADVEVGITQFQSWGVFANKHWRSIRSAIKRNPTAPTSPTEPLEGRIDDLITYLVILKSMLKEDV